MVFDEHKPYSTIDNIIMESDKPIKALDNIAIN